MLWDGNTFNYIDSFRFKLAKTINTFCFQMRYPITIKNSSQYF